MPVNRISDHVSLALTLAVLTILLVCALSRIGAAEVPADYVEGEKSAELITPEVQAAATAMMGQKNAKAFLHAMKLNMVKYDMDMRSQAGRRNWHGRLVSEEIHTNELVKVEVYSNEVSGAVWRYRLPFKPVELKKTSRKVTYSTNGIPARLAAARAKRAAQLNSGVIVTNIETTANAAVELERNPDGSLKRFTKEEFMQKSPEYRPEFANEILRNVPAAVVSNVETTANAPAN